MRARRNKSERDVFTQQVGTNLLVAAAAAAAAGDLLAAAAAIVQQNESGDTNSSSDAGCATREHKRMSRTSATSRRCEGMRVAIIYPNERTGE